MNTNLSKYVNKRVVVTWSGFYRTTGTLTYNHDTYWLEWTHPKSGRPKSQSVPDIFIRSIRHAFPWDRDGDKVLRANNLFIQYAWLAVPIGGAIIIALKIAKLIFGA